MKKSRLLGDKATRICCLLLSVVYVTQLIMSVYMWYCVICGGIAVSYVDEYGGTVSEGFLNDGEADRAVRIPEQVKITGQVDAGCRIAVTAMGANRLAFTTAAQIMLFMVMISGVRGRLYSEKNVRLLLWSGLLPIIGLFLLPLINSIIIPNLVNITSSAKLDAYDVSILSSDIKDGSSVALLLCANVLHRACIRQKEVGRKKAYTAAAE